MTGRTGRNGRTGRTGRTDKIGTPFWGIGTPFGVIGTPFGHHFGALEHHFSDPGVPRGAPFWPPGGTIVAVSGPHVPPEGAPWGPDIDFRPFWRDLGWLLGPILVSF